MKEKKFSRDEIYSIINGLIFYNAREAEKKYREQFNLKYKRITWIKVYY